VVSLCTVICTVIRTKVKRSSEHNVDTVADIVWVCTLCRWQAAAIESNESELFTSTASERKDLMEDFAGRPQPWLGQRQKAQCTQMNCWRSDFTVFPVTVCAVASHWQLPQSSQTPWTLTYYFKKLLLDFHGIFGRGLPLCTETVREMTLGVTCCLENPEDLEMLGNLISLREFHRAWRLVTLWSAYGCGSRSRCSPSIVIQEKNFLQIPELA